MDSEGWDQCVAVDVVPNEEREIFTQDWDEVLDDSSRSGLWSAARYNQLHFELKYGG